MFGRPSGPQYRMQRTNFEIPFGHAFDKRGVSSSKSAVRVGGPSIFDQPSGSAPYNTALRSNDSESERSITTWAPGRASFSQSAVIVLTPTVGEAAITSWPPRRRMATLSSQSGRRRRSRRFSLRERPTGNQERKILRSGIPARLAQNGVCDRDNHVRKSRSQCTDPDAGHSRDDRGRDDGAHRDADAPKAIGITLIDTMRDQHHS